MLNIIGMLFEHNADPTIKSNEDKTPKEVAITHNFKIGAALFGNYKLLAYKLVASC